MGTTWDQLTVNITNSMTNNSGNLLTGGVETTAPAHGSLTTPPTDTLLPGVTTLAFVASSDEKGSSELGVGPGTVTYTLPDGSPLTITYHMPFPWLQSTTVTASVGGLFAHKYWLTGSFPGHSYRGQGRRDTATIVVQMSLDTNDPKAYPSTVNLTNEN